MKILLIGSDACIRRMLAFGLMRDSDQFATVSHSHELVGLVDLLDYEVAVIDWNVRDESAYQLLASLRGTAPQLPVIAIVPTEEIGQSAQKAGVAGFVVKPVDVDELRNRLEQAGACCSKSDAPFVDGHGPRFVTKSAGMEHVLSVAWRVAPTHASVLILGENGTGKTMLARAMHARSARRHKPFVSVNCPCLQPQLLESELFGHVKGAFTGAVSDTVGKVAVAEGGTLFLDEVGELPVEVQSKLLRLLQERCYERLGESRTHIADIRVLAATNRNLRQQVLDAKFREDLYYRLNVISIEMPPLRSRPEDIIPSAEYFLREVGSAGSAVARSLGSSARQALLAHAWPGNLRELRNMIERAAILCDRRTLEAGDFPDLVGRDVGPEPQVGEFVSLDALIEAHIRRVTARADSYEQAAKILGIDKSTLYRWRKRCDGLDHHETVEALAG